MRRIVLVVIFSLLVAGAGMLLLRQYAPAPEPKHAPEVAETPVPEKPVFRPLSESEAAVAARNISPLVQGIPSWTAFGAAMETSLDYLLKKDRDAVPVETDGMDVTWGELALSMVELLELLPDLDAEPGLLTRHFRLFALEPPTLLTGYYEPWIEASLEPSEKYPYPLYGVPSDCKTIDLGQFHPRWKGQQLVYRINGDAIEPYSDRKDIDGAAALKGLGAEIAYARNLMDVFLLQVQGSGRLVLPDGSVRHILYAGKNGHPYVSLGRLLIDEGYVPQEEMSMGRIRQFVAENPVVGREMMYRNPSYVFFRLAEEGPFGSIGQVLTPMVSVAVDRHYVPLGSALLLSGGIPRIGGGEREFCSLVTAQDTGGAIKGTRCDLFCGTGPDAEYLAGHLQHDASLYLLVSKRVLGKRTDVRQQ